MTHLRFRLLPLLTFLTLLVTLSVPLSAPSAGAQAPATTRLFLPVVVGRAAPTVFGIEMHTVTSDRGLELVRSTGTRWVRRNALRWKDIQPVEGGSYRWDHPDIVALEAEMIEASRNGLNLILVVHGSPSWATKPYNVDCAPINPSKTDAFARFLAAAVERYSKPPFSVKYWEIGNEPDAMVFGGDSVFGCWGIVNDEYYGGRAYGEMLSRVYPVMKQVNPNISVLNGGLLLGRPYDPAVPDSRSGRFFEGMLIANAGKAFDILSMHSYTFYRTPGQPPLGDSLDWRVKYVRDLMKAYRVADKPIIRSETALLCVEVTPECRWAQADFVGRSFARTLRDGLLANIWYVFDNDSYHNTGLIEPVNVFVPRPAYFAYRHAARLFAGARYIGPIPDLPRGVEGYWFDRGDGMVAAFWTEGEPVPFRLAVPHGNRVACTDRDGGARACALNDGGIELVAERSPAYVRVD